ncbi:putative epsilon-lactone hydrolase, partial [Aaosphaeria arxii CBS 175.79]
AAITGPFRGRKGSDTLQHHIIQACVKKLTTRFSPVQLQYMFRSYNDIYVKYCEKHRIAPHFVTTANGGTGFWIGNVSAQYIFVNFHGGGFAMDATKSYLEFWPSIQKDLAARNIDTAWYYPTYTLTPHASYPVQFKEAVEALRYIVEDLGRQPSDIVLIGDSAGASCCLALLSHLNHPCQDLPPLQIDQPLKAAVLMSPWVSFSQDWPSCANNAHKDIDAPAVTELWSEMFLNGTKSNAYTEAVLAPDEWWKETPVEQTLVLAGEDEVLLDAIIAWYRKYQVSTHNDTTIAIGAGECHVAPLIWPLFGDRHEIKQGQALKRWLSSCLS